MIAVMRRKNHGGKIAVVPEASRPSRRNDAAERPLGILLFPVSAGLVAAAIIGVFFGTGFWLLASPASETISDSGRDPSRLNVNALKAGEAVLRLAGATETPHSESVNVVPGAPPGRRRAAAEAAPPQQNNSMQQLLPAPANGEPPVEMASVPPPASSAAVSPAYPVSLASPLAVAAADGALSAGTKGPSARDGGSAHARTVSRHWHPRSARGGPRLTHPRSLFAQTLAPPQTSSPRPDPHAINRAD